VPSFKLTIAYDGTNYHGWQIQPGIPTIQGELERALGRILNEPVTTHGSGRTDRGVHAVGQVVHFLTGRHFHTDTLMAGLNALLPPEVRVCRVEEVGDEFHARYSALSKTYQYHVWRSDVVHPFRYRYVYWFRRPLDAGAVDSATRNLIGVHDFTSFASVSGECGDHVRKVLDAKWERFDEEWVFTIRANGFLRYMVRTIVGTLLEIGVHRRGAEDLGPLLAARDRTVSGPSVPPSGLCLLNVEYPASAHDLTPTEVPGK